MNGPETPRSRAARGNGPWRLARGVLAETPGGVRVLAATVVFGGLSGVATVVLAVALAQAVGAVFLHSAGWDGVRTAVFVGVGAVCARALSEAGGRLTQARLAALVKGSLRQRLLARMFERGPAVMRERDAASLAQTVMEGVDAVATLVSVYLPQMVVAVAVPVLVLAAVGLQFWLAGLVLLVTGPLVPVFMVLVGRAAEARSRRQWELLNRLGSHFLDLVEGLTTLKLFRQSAGQTAAIERVSERYRAATMATLRVALLSGFVLELAAAISTALAAVAVSFALLDGHLAFAPAFAVLILTPEFYLPQRVLGTAFHQAMDALAAARGMEPLLAAPVYERSARHILPPAPARSVRLDRVTFRYAEAPPVLKDVTFTLDAGARIAVVGPSGAGKTTLAYLLLGYLRPAAGRILVDGTDLSNLDMRAWRREIAFVSQLPYLVFGTVRDNLLVVDPQADDRRLWQALEQADAASFVARLPGGLDARVGDRGLSLSGGEAQRVALARAFLRDASLWVLDEPTEHLDPVARMHVWEALDHHLNGRSLLLITHRPDEAAHAHRTVILEGQDIKHPSVRWATS